MRMRIFMVIAVLAFSPALNAAKAKAVPTPAAASNTSAEQNAPELKSSDAPEVTDPDLKEATPAMRQGTEEPVGGFHEHGLSGRSALILGLDLGSGSNVPKVGYRYWFSDCLAWQASLGGSYKEDALNTIDTVLAEQVGLRLKAADLGGGSFAFLELGGGGMQERKHQELATVMPTYVQFESSNVITNTYGVALGVGAELFWPRSRRASLDLNASLGSTWTSDESHRVRATDDGVSGNNDQTDTLTQSYQLGTRYSGFSAALNIYF
jgi:hypothetical protein